MYLEQKNTKILLALFVLSLSIRLVALWILPPSHLGTNAEIAYLGGARLIVEGEGFSDPSYPVFTPPLYSMFISANLYLFGDDQISVKISQALADSLTVVIVFLIIDITFGSTTALLSSVFLSVYPFLIYPVTYIGTETFFTLFLSIFVLLNLYAVNCGNWRYYCAAGFTLGVATLIRGTTQFYPVFFLLTLWAMGRLDRRIFGRFLAFCLFFILTILPWTVRNYIVLDDFIPVATAGSVFLQGSSEEFFTISGKTSQYPKYFALLRSRGIDQPLSGAKPSEKDRFLIKAGLEKYKMRIENEPLSIFPFMLQKFFRLWYATESGRNHGIIVAVNISIYVLALTGLILVLLRREELALLVLSMISYFVTLHWISLPLFRYMVPVMPYVIAFAAFAVVAIGERFTLSHPEATSSGRYGDVNRTKPCATEN